MYRIGEYNTLQVVKIVDFGVYLGTDDEKVLFPGTESGDDMQLGDEVKVFVYTDSEDRPIATRTNPTAIVGDIVCLEILDINRTGAFLDWGIPKDLFLPFGKQRRRFDVGEDVVVKVSFDEVSQRVIASTKVAAPYDVDKGELKEGQKVEIMVLDTYDTGMRVLVNGVYSGLVYHSDIVEPLVVGQKLEAYLSQIRPDTKLDISLKPFGHLSVSGDQKIIIDIIVKAGGSVPYTAKTDSDTIKEVFKLSKKSFKKAIGGLYKEHRIKISDSGLKFIR